MTDLAEVRDLEAEAWDLMARIASANPTTDVGVIQEFADLARLRELARRLGWGESDVPSLDEFYALRAEQVRVIIEEGR